jgi:MFS family permease
VKENSYRNYLLGVLLAVFAFNAVDTNALGLVLQNIKADFHLSDTQLGLLTGIAFALFYSVMGIPIARWADRGNRIVIIATSTALWSLAVTLSGVAGSFLQLLLIRVFVAIGEAGCMPPAHSLIADYFDRAERPRAVSIYMLGGMLSVCIGSFMGGWLNEFFGWRVMFLCLGAPGLALATLVWFTLKEPRKDRKSTRETVGSVQALQPLLSEVCQVLWRNRAFRNILLGWAVASLFGSGMGQWQSVYFIRHFGMNTGELGSWLTVIFVTCGFVGTYCGGTLASRYAANNERRQINTIAIAYVGFGCVSALMYFSPNKYLALALMALSVLGGATTIGPLFATIQSLVPARMRATSIAVIYLCTNLIGLGLGPLAVGALSDGLRPWAGERSLRDALLAMSPGYLWAAWHYWRATKTIARDVANAEQDRGSNLLTPPGQPSGEADLRVNEVHGEVAVLVGPSEKLK